MKKTFFVISISVLFCTLQIQAALTDSVASYLNFAEKQFKSNVLGATDPTKFARSFDPVKNSIRWVSSSDWTAGFYPGIMWLFYEYTADDFWRSKALAFTAAMNGQQYTSTDHDIGFKVLYSFGNAWKYTQKDTFASVIRTGALKFEQIYNPTVGCTRSWFHTPSRVPAAFKPTKFTVIIDNMMNIELFLKATDITNDNRFKNMALQHAYTTSVNHIRPDSSTYHVVDFDPLTGLYRWKGTQQGFDHESTWSRGQAWGIYGYTTMYTETGVLSMLQIAEKLAKKFIRNIPADKVVYYDFSLPDTVIQARRWRDVSAAAIAASAFIDLYKITSNSLYLNSAEDMLTAISGQGYRCTPGSFGNFILTKSTGGKDYYTQEPVNYADYYYVEALLKYAKLKNILIPKKLRTEVRNDLNFRVKKNQQLTEVIRLHNFEAGVTQLNISSGLYDNSIIYSFNSSTNEFSFLCNNAGTYTFPLTITENGKSYTEYIQLTVDNTTDLNQSIYKQDFDFSYNRSNKMLRINNSLQPPFSILDAVGQMLYKSNDYTISTSLLTNGLYFIGNISTCYKKLIIN